MRETANTILHGVGAMAVMIGLVVMVGAAGNSDLGKGAADIAPYMFKGIALLLSGSVLAGWTL